MNVTGRDDLIPINVYRHGRYLRSGTDGTGRWRNFSSRICRHPFVRRTLFERSYGDCRWCGHLLVGNTVVHHIDYNHSCSSDRFIRIDSTTAKRPERTSKVPDCERCHRDDPMSFDACMCRIVLVHVGCHFEIHRADRSRAPAR